ncbi:MAG: RNA polymerase subunit sigma-70 [Planctomycetes bacterium]|jgi:RNA polymerase sigma factor (TIGR02999 family)|nr:RNA polymerase subunit sigma-70 [Planctomycetota bacterium]
MREGDASAAHEMLPLVYDELRRIAGQILRPGQGPSTLQPTALVHEAWLKLSKAAEGGAQLNDRCHFLAVAARAMRQVLVNHARDRKAQKRGGGAARVPLDDYLGVLEAKTGSVVELDDLLMRFAADFPRPAQVVELRVFGGLTLDEAAAALGIAASTVSEDWRFARAWLMRALPGAASM